MRGNDLLRACENLPANANGGGLRQAAFVPGNFPLGVDQAKLRRQDENGQAVICAFTKVLPQDTERGAVVSLHSAKRTPGANLSLRTPENQQPPHPPSFFQGVQSWVITSPSRDRFRRFDRCFSVFLFFQRKM
jgi:hypothetical protein